MRHTIFTATIISCRWTPYYYVVIRRNKEKKKARSEWCQLDLYYQDIWMLRFIWTGRSPSERWEASSREGQIYCLPLSAHELWKEEDHNVLSGVSAGGYLEGVYENNIVWGNSRLRLIAKANFNDMVICFLNLLKCRSDETRKTFSDARNTISRDVRPPTLTLNIKSRLNNSHSSSGLILRACSWRSSF